MTFFVVRSLHNSGFVNSPFSRIQRMYGLSIGSSARSPISGEYPADWDLAFHVQFGIMRQLFPWKVTVQLNAYLYNPPVSLPTLSDVANKGRFAFKSLLPHGPQKLYVRLPQNYPYLKYPIVQAVSANVRQFCDK